MRVDTDHPYLSERGLNPATIKEFCIGMCTSERSMMAGRIIIPITHWDPATNDAYLVAHAGRVPRESPDADIDKYLFPPDFHKSAVVYNLIDAGRRRRDDVLHRLIRKVSVRVVDLEEPPDELSERALRAALHL